MKAHLGLWFLACGVESRVWALGPDFSRGISRFRAWRFREEFHGFRGMSYVNFIQGKVRSSEAVPYRFLASLSVYPGKSPVHGEGTLARAGNLEINDPRHASFVGEGEYYHQTRLSFEGHAGSQPQRARGCPTKSVPRTAAQAAPGQDANLQRSYKPADAQFVVKMLHSKCINSTAKRATATDVIEASNYKPDRDRDVKKGLDVLIMNETSFGSFPAKSPGMRIAGRLPRSRFSSSWISRANT